MGRRARIPKDPPIKKIADIVTNERLEQVFKVLASTGLGLIMYAYLWASARSWEATKQGFMTGTWTKNSIGSPFQVSDFLNGASSIFKLINDDMKMIAPRVKNNNDVVKNFEKNVIQIQKDFEQGAKILWDSYQRDLKDAKTDARKAQLLKNYETGMKTITETRDQRLKNAEISVSSARQKLEADVATAEEMLKMGDVLHAGISLMAAGGTYWMMSHPEVVKQIVISAEKVMVRAIDESSEIIDKSGEAIKDVINALYPWKSII